MRVLLMRVLLASIMILVAAMLLRPVLADPPANPESNGSSLSGSGAPYLERSNKALAAATSLHLRASMTITKQPKKAEKQIEHASVEVATASGKRFRTSILRDRNSLVVVGNGQSVYVYEPDTNEYTKEDGYQQEAADAMIQMRLTTVFGPGSPTWDYLRTETLDGNKCDVIQTHAGSPTVTIYLDRTTHMPRKTTVSGQGPGGSATIETTFTEFVLNTDLPASLFEWTPPNGAKLVPPKDPGPYSRFGQG